MSDHEQPPYDDGIADVLSVMTPEELAHARRLVVYHGAPWPVVVEIHRTPKEEQ